VGEGGGRMDNRVAVNIYAFWRTFERTMPKSDETNIV